MVTYDPNFVTLIGTSWSHFVDLVRSDHNFWCVVKKVRIIMTGKRRGQKKKLQHSCKGFQINFRFMVWVLNALKYKDIRLNDRVKMACFGHLRTKYV
jgi:hypothetical protein